MRRAVHALLLFAALTIAAPWPLHAQEEERPRRGKIDKVEDEASGQDDAQIGRASCRERVLPGV